MKTIQKISALFLSVLILLFSFGFTINKMVCLESGNTKVSLNDIKNCCSNDTKAAIPVLKSHCCDLSSTAFHLNDYNPSEQHSIPMATDCLLPFNHIVATTFCVENNKQVLLYSDLPPPLYGKKLLSFISVFII